MSGFNGWLWVTLSGAISFGLLLALPGRIKAALAKRLGMGEADAEPIFAAFKLTLIPTMLIAGLLIDSWGAHEVLILGSVLSAVGVFALSLGRSSRDSLFAVLLTGVGAACVGNSATVLMPRSLFPNSPAASLNLGYVFFGLGALLTPVLVDLLLRIMSLRQTLGTLAGICLLPAVLAVAAGQLALPATAPWSTLSAPVVWVSAILFMLYSPLEAWLGTSAGSYLAELGYKRRRAAMLLALVWMAFLGARLYVAYLQQQELLTSDSDIWLIWVLALLAVITLGNLAGTHSRGNAAVALLLTAVFLGPLFPTLVGFLFKMLDPQQHGAAFGLMYSLGASGSCLLAPIFSPTRPVPLRVPLYLLIGVALALVGTGLALALTHS